MRKQSNAEIEAARRAEENAAYRREINTLIEQIEKLFREELPNVQHLSSQSVCIAVYDAAVFVQSLRTFRENRGQPKRPKFSPLQKAARAMRRPLAAERRAVERAFEREIPDGTPQPIIDRLYAIGLEEIEIAERAVIPFIKKTAGFDATSEMGRRIAAAFTAFGMRVAKNPKSESPYVHLVTQTLALGRVHQSSATTAERLRGRASRSRSGKRK
jgi:hypothetical protein